MNAHDLLARGAELDNIVHKLATERARIAEDLRASGRTDDILEKLRNLEAEEITAASAILRLHEMWRREWLP
jgi:hypothetical protein